MTTALEDLRALHWKWRTADVGEALDDIIEKMEREKPSGYDKQNAEWFRTKATNAQIDEMIAHRNRLMAEVSELRRALASSEGRGK